MSSIDSERDNASTARRERAEKWCEENASSPLCSCYCEKAYLAGAREETTLIVMEIVNLQIENDNLNSMLQTTAACADRAIKEKDAKIAALQASCDEWRSRASNKATDNMDLRAEIAALREELKDAHSQIENLQYELIEADEIEEGR